MTKIKNPEFEQDILSGKFSQSELTKKYGYKSEMVKNRAKKLGVILQENYIKYKVNDNFFSIWSNNMAYILGFIMADGCLPYRAGKPSSSLDFGLAKLDKKILENINIMMESNFPIYTYDNMKSGHSRSSLYIRNKKIVSDLNGLGIMARKTFLLKWIDCCPSEFHSHLCRGYFDGDGSIFIHTNKKPSGKIIKKPAILICGTMSVLEGILDSCKIYGKIYKHKPIFILRFYNKKAIEFCEWIYKDSIEINRLSRKYDRYVEYKML
jgi:hypothetical protein